MTHVKHGLFISVSGKRYLVGLFQVQNPTLSALCVSKEKEIYQAFQVKWTKICFPRRMILKWNIWYLIKMWTYKSVSVRVMISWIRKGYIVTKNKAPFFIFFWPMKKFINRDMCLIESNVKQKEINETCDIIELFLIFKT